MIPSPLPSCPSNATPAGPRPPLPSRPDNAAAPTTQRHALRLCHPSPPPTPCRHPTNTAARPPPPSHPNNAAVRALRRHLLTNSVARQPLPKLIVVCYRLPASCHCHPACAESVILSAHHAESMIILSAPFGVITLTAVAAKKTNNNGQYCQSPINEFGQQHLNGAADWSAAEGGQVLPHFERLFPGRLGLSDCNRTFSIYH